MIAKHRVVFDSYGGYDRMTGAYSIVPLCLPHYTIVADVETGHEEVPELRDLMEQLSKFLDAAWDARLEYPYEISIRL